MGKFNCHTIHNFPCLGANLTLAWFSSPICPQPSFKSVEEELFNLTEDCIPNQALEQSEFDCLNLNITCPANATPDSHLPVMLWIHG